MNRVRIIILTLGATLLFASCRDEISGQYYCPGSHSAAINEAGAPYPVIYELRASKEGSLVNFEFMNPWTSTPTAMYSGEVDPNGKIKTLSGVEGVDAPCPGKFSADLKVVNGEKFWVARGETKKCGHVEMNCKMELQ